MNKLIIFLLPVLLISFSGVNTLAFTSDSDYFYDSQTLPENSYYMVELKAEEDAIYNLTLDNVSSNVDFLLLSNSENNTYQSNFITGKTLDIASSMDFLDINYLYLENWFIEDGESIFIVIENANYTLSTVFDEAANCTKEVDFSLNISYSNVQLGIESIYLRQEGINNSDGNNSDGFLIYSLLAIIPIFIGRKWKK